jgi:tetratricopeptide (TPR) repeat protein
MGARCSLLENEASHATTHKGLEAIAKEMTLLRRDLRSRRNNIANSEYGDNGFNARVVDNLVNVISSGEKIVSSASTITGRSVGTPSVDGHTLSQEHKDSMYKWIPPPGIPEDEDFEPPRPPVANDFTPQSPISEGLPDDFFSDSAAETTATSTQYSTTQSRKDPEEDTDFDLETSLIEHFQKLGRDRYAQEKYADAEGILTKTIEKAEAKFGPEGIYKGRQETIEYLAMAMIKQGKFDEVEALLDKQIAQFKGREKIVKIIMDAHLKNGEWEKVEAVLVKYTPADKMDKALENLAVSCCQQGDFDYAEKLLLKHTDFEGREPVLEQIAMSCYQKRKWEEADIFLREFLKNKDSEQTPRVYEAVHTLGDVCLQNNELVDAENFCRRAVEGRKKMFGRRHALFHQSVYLLVEICYAKEDPLEAEGWAEFLPPSFQRKSLGEENI